MIGKIKYVLSKVLKKFVNIPAIKSCDIDKTSRVCSGSHVVNSTMKRYSYIGNNCSVVYTDIGNFCSIADYCVIGGANHPIEWVSTSPVFHSGKNIMHKNFSNHNFKPYKNTIIGNDVWIASNCIIKFGIIIGDGAVIGMGSIVTKNVEPYTIVAGNPAKLIRKRFDDDIIGKLLKSQWWDLDDNALSEKSKQFDDINKFLCN